MTGIVHTPVTTYEYDASGRRTSLTITDSTGGDTARTWSWQYDPAGRLVKETTPDGVETTYVWDDAGDLIASDIPGPLGMEYVYDAAHRLIETAAVGVRADPNVWAWKRYVVESRVYDGYGQLYSIADPIGEQIFVNYYDGLPAYTARVTRDSNGYIEKSLVLDAYDYDAPGNLIRSSGANGDTELWQRGHFTDGERTAAYTYDNAGYLLSQELDPADLKRLTTYTRNLDGSIATISRQRTGDDTRIEQTHFEYDAAGRLTSEIVANPGGTPTQLASSYTYDPRGLLTRQTAPDAQTTDFAYDALGRLTQTVGVARTTWENGSATADVKPTAITGYNTFGDVTHQQDPSGAVVTRTVDAMGRVTATTLPDYYPPGAQIPITATTTTTYDERGLPTQIMDPLGRITDLTYHPRGWLYLLDKPDPDGSGPKERVTLQHWYDGAGRINQVSGDGTNRGVKYDWIGRVSQAGVYDTDQEGNSRWLYTNYGYDASGNRTLITSPLGHTTFMAYNAAGQPTAVIDPTETPVELEYDFAGRLSRKVLAHTRATAFTYDLAGRLATESDHTVTSAPAAGQTPGEHGYLRSVSAGQFVPATDPTGLTGFSKNIELDLPFAFPYFGQNHSSVYVQSSGYLSFGDNTRRYSNSALPNGEAPNAAIYAFWDTLVLDESSTVSTRIEGSPGERIFTVEWLDAHFYGNSADRITFQVNLHESGAISLSYQGLDDEDWREKGGSATVGIESHDGLSALQHSHNEQVLSDDTVIHFKPIIEYETSLDEPALRSQGISYDAAGRPIERISAEGQTTAYGYDPAGHLVSISQQPDPTAQESRIDVDLGYDAAGRMTLQEDGAGNPTIFTYNVWGLPESTVEQSTLQHPDLADRTWATVYDEAGQPIVELLPGGVRRQRTFDGMGRLIEETGTGAATDVRRFDYDEAGRVTLVGSPAGDTQYSYNGRGLLVSSSGIGGDASFSYDDDGRLIGRTDAAGSSTFGYDGAGRLTAITDPLTGQNISQTYLPTGEISSIAYGTNAVTRTYQYDELGRLTGDTVKRTDQTTTASISYVWDKDDLLVEKSTAGLADAGVHSYTYDDVGRLSGWTAPDGETFGYAYDKASNRVSITSAEGVRTFTYDARNRLQGATGAQQPNETYSWTPRGTLESISTNGQLTDVTFDAFERLTNITTASYDVTYSYDALDRISQRNGASFTYDGLTNNATRVPAPTEQTTLFRTPDGSAISDQGSSAGTNSRILVNDGAHNDNVAAADPTTGDIESTQGFDPFGDSTGTSGSLPLGFQGGWTDPDSGMVNAHARWYLPGAGTFASRDTWTLAPDPVAQVNRYLYANGNPVTRVDPSGHASGRARKQNCSDFALDAGTGFMVDTRGGYAVIPARYAPQPLTKTDAAKTAGRTAALRALTAVNVGSTVLMALSLGGDSSMDQQRWSYMKIDNDYYREHCKGFGELQIGSQPSVAVKPHRPERLERCAFQPHVFGCGPIPTRGTRPTTCSATGTCPPPPPRCWTCEWVNTPIPRPRVAPIDGRPERTDAMRGRGIFTSPGEDPTPHTIITEERYPTPKAELYGVDMDNPGNNRDRSKNETDCLSGRVSSGTINYYDLDHSISDPRGRATGGDACYEGPLPTTGTAATYRPPGYARGVHDSGHLIGRALGGVGAASDPNSPKNLVPLYRNANYPVMYLAVEKYVRDRVTAGEAVFYQVRPIYNGSDPVPIAVNVLISGDRFATQTFTIDNTPGAYVPLPGR